MDAVVGESDGAISGQKKDTATAWPEMPLIPANPTGKITRRPRAGCARHAAASCRPPLAARSPAQAPSPFRFSAFLTFGMGVRRPLSAGPQTMRFKAVARPLNLATIPGSTQSTTAPPPIVDRESSIGRAPNRHCPQRLPLRQQKRPKQTATPRARIPTADSDRAAPAGGRGAARLRRAPKDRPIRVGSPPNRRQGTADGEDPPAGRPPPADPGSAASAGQAAAVDGGSAWERTETLQRGRRRRAVRPPLPVKPGL